VSDWKVIHRSIDGVSLAECAPEQLSWGRYLNRPGYINYDIDLTHFAAKYENCGAYRTDFELKRDDLTILSGLHNAVAADMDEDVIHVAGAGWLHYLERRQWPFAMGQDQSSSGQIWFDVDVGDIVTDLVTAAMVNGKGVNYGMANQQLGIKTNYRIEPADTGTLFDKVTELSQQQPGFDFVCDNDKNFQMFVPSKGEQVTAYSLELGRNIKSVHYGDNGPVGNYILGTGAGSSNKLAWGESNLDSEAIYRRLDTSADFGDNPNVSSVRRLTDHQLDKSSVPDLDLWVTVYPEEYDLAYTAVDVGDMLKVMADLTYVKLDDLYRVTGIEGYLNAQGDEQIVFTFNDHTMSNA